MGKCKYLLPCGRCDQRGAPCDVTIKQLEMYDSLEQPKECNHDWIIEITKSDYMDGHGNEYCVMHKYCSKCGTIDIRMYQIKT